MSSLDFAPRRWIAGVFLGLLMSAPAVAATYQVRLFEGTTPTGTGSFDFTNTGSAGAFLVPIGDLATNASSSAGAQAFNDEDASVQVATVGFSDGKTAAPAGANNISGNFVEGLTGIFRTPAAAGNSLGGIPCPGATCFYRITFAFTPNANPNLATKSYTIEFLQPRVVGVLASVSGTYSVSNTLTIPEPGSLALLALSLAGLAWFQRRSAARVTR